MLATLLIPKPPSPPQGNILKPTGVFTVDLSRVILEMWGTCSEMLHALESSLPLGSDSSSADTSLEEEDRPACTLTVREASSDRGQPRDGCSSQSTDLVSRCPQGSAAAAFRSGHLSDPETQALPSQRSALCLLTCWLSRLNSGRCLLHAIILDGPLDVSVVTSQPCPQAVT